MTTPFHEGGPPRGLERLIGVPVLSEIPRGRDRPAAMKHCPMSKAGHPASTEQYQQDREPSEWNNEELQHRTSPLHDTTVEWEVWRVPANWGPGE